MSTSSAIGIFSICPQTTLTVISRKLEPPGNLTSESGIDKIANFLLQEMVAKFKAEGLNKQQLYTYSISLPYGYTFSFCFDDKQITIGLEKKLEDKKEHAMWFQITNCTREQLDAENFLTELKDRIKSFLEKYTTPGQV